MTKDKYVYYFTFARDKEESGHPYSGGWSIVEAPDMGSAQKIFNAVHPEKERNRPRCSSVYSSDVWGETLMAQQGHNFGHACHEKISWEVYDRQ